MANFYLDNDVSIVVGSMLESYGHDVVTARDLGLAASHDHEQLLLAAEVDRILVSHNWKDYRLLHNAWLLWSREWGVHVEHSGIIIVSHGSPDQIARRIDEFARAYHALRGALCRERHGVIAP